MFRSPRAAALLAGVALAALPAAARAHVDTGGKPAVVIFTDSQCAIALAKASDVRRTSRAVTAELAG